MNIFSLLCVAAGLLAAPARAAADRDIVSVNGTVIRQSEVMERLWKRYGPETLEEMVNEVLLRQAAQAQGLKVEAPEVDKQVDRFKKQFSDPAMIEEQLQKSGSSLEKLKAQLLDQLLIRKLLMSALKVSVKDAELQKVFQERREKLATPPSVHLRLIAVKTKAEADEVLAKLKDGADFAALARARSMASTGKLTGGDYGFVTKGMLPETTEKVAFAMKAGELQMIPMPNSFNIIQVLEKRPAQPAKFDAVKEDLRDLLLESKIKSLLPGYIDDLRRKAEIKPIGTAE
ncbi:MAG: peptidyl-prolyl cis-trans isomerase [Elusimicrobia bacterium]|nr:peptidyl-prolyl cis-trans isomerase [Elusimicrobiota bacterium]